MKQITLSAAIMALAMMGCSDAGLDNSVASTSEVNNEQIQQNVVSMPVLKRDVYAEPFTHGDNGYMRYAYPGHAIEVQSYATPDKRGRGQLHIMSGVAPVAINVVTVAVAGCGGSGENFVCLDVRYKTKKNEQSGAMEVIADTEEMSDWVQPGGIGVVSAFAAVWNPGKANEFIFSTVTYGGALNEYSAYMVYNKYLLPYYEANN